MLLETTPLSGLVFFTGLLFDLQTTIPTTPPAQNPPQSFWGTVIGAALVFLGTGFGVLMTYLAKRSEIRIIKSKNEADIALKDKEIALKDREIEGINVRFLEDLKLKEREIQIREKEAEAKLLGFDLEVAKKDHENRLQIIKLETAVETNKRFIEQLKSEREAFSISTAIALQNEFSNRLGYRAKRYVSAVRILDETGRSEFERYWEGFRVSRDGVQVPELECSIQVFTPGARFTTPPELFKHDADPEIDLIARRAADANYEMSMRFGEVLTRDSGEIVRAGFKAVAENAFLMNLADLASHYGQNQYEWEQSESWGSCPYVPVDELVIELTFPKNHFPGQVGFGVVAFNNRFINQMEQDRISAGSFTRRNNTVLLRVSTPLPGFCYFIHWKPAR